MRRPGLMRRLMVVATLAACGDSVGPEELVGDYLLTHVHGQSLPQLVAATINCDIELAGGELKLRQVDWSDLNLVQRIDCSPVGGRTEEVGIRYLGRFHVTGETITFVTLRSETDTLRFTGRVRGSVVELEVTDAARWLPVPTLLRFGPRTPPDQGS